MKVGIIAGSMSPVHRGHWSLIQRASTENDHVMVIVSAVDRRDNGITIHGRDMVEIWQRFLVPFLPGNVKLTLGTPGSSPVRKVYEILGDASEKGSVDSYTVYSDPVDIQDRFGLAKQKKYFGDLLKHGQVIFTAIEREGDFDVSGAQMRKLLKNGMRDEFISLLPPQVDGNGIWSFLALRTLVR